MNALSPPGRRQVLASITVKNHAATMTYAYAVYRNAITSLKRAKGLSWTLVIQPLLPDWLHRGDPNPLGLNDVKEFLVLISFPVNWLRNADNEFVQKATRQAIEEIETVASEDETSHPWEYLNYCTQWLKPFEGYGVENLRFLQEFSRKYDPEGFFSRGVCWWLQA